MAPARHSSGRCTHDEGEDEDEGPTSGLDSSGTAAEIAQQATTAMDLVMEACARGSRPLPPARSPAAMTTRAATTTRKGKSKSKSKDTDKKRGRD